MDFINSIFHFFTDKSRHFGTKATLLLTLLLLIVVVDNLFSFSYYYNNSQKISQVNELTQVLKEPNLTPREMEKLMSLRKDIIDHTNLKDYARSFFLNISFTSSKKTTTANTNTAKPIIDRSYTWHFISSSWFLLIVMIILPVVLFVDKGTSFGEWFLITAIIEFFLFAFSWLFAKAFSYIPLILNTPFINYVVNAALCFGIIFLFSFISKATKQD